MATLAATLFLLSAGAVQTTQAPDSGFTISAIQTETPPQIDGVVADSEWANASRTTDFIRFEPQRGTISPFRTDAMVLYEEGDWTGRTTAQRQVAEVKSRLRSRPMRTRRSGKW